MVELSASVTMTRALDKLKTALKSAGITATLDVPGTSRILLYLTGSDIAVACRTNAEAGHQWWFWLGPEPIGPACNPAAAAQQIKSRLTSGRGTVNGPAADLSKNHQAAFADLRAVAEDGGRAG